jgi:hypothetical protein
MKLQDIGFYTLSNERAENVSPVSPLHFWFENELRNVRFSGGEPTLHHGLKQAISLCKKHNVEHIAISTNGTCSLNRYHELIDAGVNDFSISLDACCASVGKEMTGGINVFDKIVKTIEDLSKKTYVTVGVVFTEKNIDQCVDIVRFADSLGVSDVRVIPSAQYDKALLQLIEVAPDLLDKHPILKYRANHVIEGRHIRGIRDQDTKACPLVLDDIAVAGKYHFPCIIYMREQGNPIGKISNTMRLERLSWLQNTNTHLDPICKRNCIDACVDHNNYVMKNNKLIQNLKGML